jgi:hypothetical protein
LAGHRADPLGERADAGLPRLVVAPFELGQKRTAP